MAYNNIEALLEKYWEGETSLAEEQTLRDYFNSGNVDPKFAEVAPMFQFFKATEGNKLPDDFEAKLIAKLETEQEKTSTTFLVKPKQEAKHLRLFTRIASVAALLAIAIGVGLFTMQPKGLEKEQLAWEDTYEDPEKAYEETIAALKLISEKLNRGKRETAKGLLKLKNKTNFTKK